jgi:hypothetical protein
MADLQHDNLSVGIRKSSDGLRYEVGVTVNDVFFPFGTFRADVFERELVAAQEAKQAQAQAPPVAQG